MSINPPRQAVKHTAESAGQCCSLIAIEGPEPLRQWLGRLGRDAPFMVRDVARQALGGPRPDGDPA